MIFYNTIDITFSYVKEKSLFKGQGQVNVPPAQRETMMMMITGQEAHTTRPYASFCGKMQLRVLPLPLDEMLVFHGLSLGISL